jgi:hypothetical protein
MNSALTHWKSTVSGILTTTLATTAAFLAPPMNSLISSKHVLWIGAFQVLGKIWISLITQDAGTVLAKVPGSSDPQIVPAHSVPDDPKAVAIVPTSNPS